MGDKRKFAFLATKRAIKTVQNAVLMARFFLLHSLLRRCIISVDNMGSIISVAIIGNVFLRHQTPHSSLPRTALRNLGSMAKPKRSAISKSARAAGRFWVV